MTGKLKQAFVLLGTTLALASCVDDLGIGAPKESKLDEVYFTASIAEQDFFGTKKPQTRSAAEEKQRVQAGFYDLAIDGRNDILLSVSTLDGMFGKQAPMPEAGKNNGTTRGAMLAELAQKPMSVVEYAKTSDGKTIVGEPYTAYTEDGSTWGGSHIQQSSKAVLRTLHAIYPSSESYTIDAAAGTVAYTTPESSVDQSDLLYAEAEQGLGSEVKETVHLTFDHILTAVRFKVGSQHLPMSVIKSISIDGIATSGTYNFSNKSWDLSNAATGKVSCSLNFTVAGAENIVINGGENTFMLLPQQLTQNAKVTIEYNDYTEGEMQTAEVKKLTASLATSGTPAWVAGQCITYSLMDKDDKDNYILEVEEPKEFSPDGGEQYINVISYHHDGGINTPKRWMVQSYSSDGGKTWMSGGASNPPAGMSISPQEGLSKDTIMPVTVSLKALQPVSAPHSDFLRYKTPLGNDGEAFDLSRHDYLNQPCAQTTANCYVVDAPGKYRIPTAYGNAIVNGKTNKDAYTDKAGYKHCETKNNFMTHNGKAITAPMIKNNGINLTRATLVWEDSEKLIDHNSIKLVDDGNAIEFEILPDNIAQGNAVIAAMDGNTVAWSWHIWVTDEKASLAEPISDNSVDFMPLTLGWCSTANASGQIGHEFAVRITMPENLKKRANFRIRQNSSPSQDAYENTMGNATYYNWGRKDPFPGAISTNKPTGSDDDAQALPKPFYQAGTDAASLGLHSELHAEYGSDCAELFIQGALVGLDGFLTGYAIGNAYKNYVSLKKEYKAMLNTKAEINGKYYDMSDDIVRLEYVPQDDLDLEEAIRTQKFVGQNADIINNAASAEKASYYTEGYYVNSGMVLFDGNGDGTHYIRFITDDLAIWDKAHEHVIELQHYVVMQFFTLTPVTTPAPTLALGDFSGAYLALAGSAASATFGNATAGSVNFGAAIANSSLFKGGTEWCKEMKSHGVSVNYGIQHPNILMRDPISWVNHDGVGNLWNAAQIDYDNKERPVVKSIYDPCPAGYHVPSAHEMSAINDESTFLSFVHATGKETNSGKKLHFPALGCRSFWSASEPGAAVNNNINDLIMFNGDQGMYWTASPAINQNEMGEKGAYAINFRGTSSFVDYGKKGVEYTPRVVNNLKLQQSYALPIRPVKEK